MDDGYLIEPNLKEQVSLRLKSDLEGEMNELAREQTGSDDKQRLQLPDAPANEEGVRFGLWFRSWFTSVQLPDAPANQEVGGETLPGNLLGSNVTNSRKTVDFLTSDQALQERLAFGQNKFIGVCMGWSWNVDWLVYPLLFYVQLFGVICYMPFWDQVFRGNVYIGDIYHASHKLTFLQGVTHPWTVLSYLWLICFIVGLWHMIRFWRRDLVFSPMEKSLFLVTALIVSLLAISAFGDLSYYALWSFWCLFTISVLCIWSKCYGKIIGARFPQIVQLSNEGLQFSWFKVPPFRLRPPGANMTSAGLLYASIPGIPWNAISRVCVRKLKIKGGGGDDLLGQSMLVFNIDFSLIVDKVALLLGTKSFSRWFDLEEDNFRGGTMKRIEVNFPMVALTLESDRPKFLAELMVRLPETAQSPEFKALLQSASGTSIESGSSYTQFWFADLQSSRRRSTQELIVGDVLQDGRYFIEGRIATGGQATVYKGRAVLDGESRTIAIKEFVLPESGGRGARGRSFESVGKEAFLLSSLKHPAIAKLLDNFVEDQRIYLCFEYVDGRSLRSIVDDDGSLPPTEVVAIARMVADVLAYLHGCTPPVVHRDLSPDNLMLTPEGRLVLIDFNVAEQLESSDTKTVVGKHHYMAPEQFKGKPCPQSDLYSMGCCLYFLVTGKDPRPLSQIKLAEILSDETGNHPAVAIGPELMLLDKVTARLTDLALSERYKSIEEVQQDLVEEP
jgi:hypothetical protein